MDTAMRDMERIREKDPEQGAVRRVAVLGLAALATIALIFAVGVMIGNADGSGQDGKDPLQDLDQAAGLAPKTEAKGSKAAPDPADSEADVDPKELTFPHTLVEPRSGGDGSGKDTGAERPEVAAAMAAAEAELEHPDPLHGRGARGGSSTPAGPTGTRGGSSKDGSGSGGSLPAAVAAAPDSESLADNARHDPLVASALPKANGGAETAPKGRPGKYTLQVISYRSPEEARAFAKALRERGHKAFVVSAVIPERGRHWRVRIGPFEHKHEAESYRQSFEEEERMNTYIVKRDDNKS